jgi:hypothetical protein
MRLKVAYCLLVLLVGCAQPPRPSSYPYSSQPHMQGVDHWQMLASQAAWELAASFRGEPASSIEPVYVQSDDRAPVGKAFRSFLITALTKHGVAVSLNPDNPLGISADRLYGFERFILRKSWQDVLSLDSDGDEWCSLFYKPVREAPGTGGRGPQGMHSLFSGGDPSHGKSLASSKAIVICAPSAVSASI